jgi:protein-tyrosine phosphatase
MYTKIYWVPGPWHGRLGIVPRPRGGDWLSDETRAWRHAGIDVVVSLLEPEEESQLILQNEAAAAAESGIDFRPFPIPDRGVPVSRMSVAELGDGIVDALDQGKNVAVHCRQGIGRSALVVGSVLVAAGADTATALKVIEESRGLGVPETDEQRQWLRDFATWLTATRAAHQAAAADERRRSIRSDSR